MKYKYAKYRLKGEIMKIETLQTLLLSWLRNVKRCQLVNTNWKSSSEWELKHKEILEQIIQNCSNILKSKYGYNLHSGNSSKEQLLLQAERDLIGVSYDENSNEHVYAIDVAFNEDELSYGTNEETVFRVIKKCIRTAICMYGYFNFENGTIIFISPKINYTVINDIYACVNDIVSIMNDLGLNYKIRIFANDDFMDKVLEPVINLLDDSQDTSESFMENLQIYNVSAEKKFKTVSKVAKKWAQSDTSSVFDALEYSGKVGLEEMKIGFIVRTVLRKMLEKGEVPKREIDLLQMKQYSKETFHIQYPLLQKASITNGRSPMRYYSSPVKIHGEDYFMCSEWYEVTANNDRPYLLKWLVLHKN